MAPILPAKRWRLAPILIPSLVIGVSMFCIAYLVAWRQYGVMPAVSPRSRIVHDMRQLHTALEAYRVKTGRLPEKLEELPSTEDLHLRLDDQGRVVDRWKHAIAYIHIPDGFEVWSYGRDGVPGGEGLDADICGDGRGFKESFPTLRQFASEYRDPGMFGACGASAVVGIAAYFFGLRSTEAKTLRRGTMLAYMLITIAFSSLFACVLVFAHIPSGH